MSLYIAWFIIGIAALAFGCVAARSPMFWVISSIISATAAFIWASETLLNHYFG